MNIETSQDLKELFAALAKAQGEMKPAPKKALNPAFARGSSKGSKYADLADCVESIRPHLTKNGLCLSQMYGGPTIVTLLGHESGQWMRSQVQIPNFDSLNPQQIGSATTYLRRYSLGIVGLVTDEDDDGNAASDKAEPRGVTTVDPRGENRAPQDETTVKQYVERFQKAMDNPDDKAAAEDVYKIHLEVASSTDLYIAIGDALGSKYKNALHKFVAAYKKSQKEAA